MKRYATLAEDGWELVSAEARHAENPTTFRIPDRRRRESLQRGDAAKLLFDIETREGGAVVDRGVDRMWVVVTGRDGDDYTGILESDPGAAENLSLRRGTEIHFRPEHVCAVERPPEEWLRQRFESGAARTRARSLGLLMFGFMSAVAVVILFTQESIDRLDWVLIIGMPFAMGAFAWFIGLHHDPTAG